MDEDKGELPEKKIIDSVLLKTFFDDSPLGVVIIHEGIILYINDALCKSMGITTEMALNQNIALLTQVLEPELRELALKRFHSVERLERSFDKERYNLTTQDGKRRTLEITSNVVEISDIRYVIAYADDVTEDQEIRDSTARERKAFGIIAEAALSSESTPQVCEKVLNGLIENLGFDLGTVRLFNKEQNSLDLISSIGFDDVKAESSIEVSNPNFLAARTARTKQPLFIPDLSEISEDIERMFKAKKMGLQSLIFWPLIGTDDTLIGVINVASHKKRSIGLIDRGFFTTVASMFSTVLERRDTEEKLKESQEQFIAFADNLPGPVFIKDHESKVIFINRFMRSMSPRPDSTGLSNVDLFDHLRAEELTTEDQKVLARGPIDRIQKTRDKDGKMRTYRSHKFPIFREGKSPLIGGFSLDITERVEAENQREEAKARAEFFNDLMAHDINNMHQGIMASLELILEDDELPERLRIIADRALKQVDRSVSLINNVKKFTMINQGDIQLEKTDPAEDLIVAIETVKQSFPHLQINVKTNISKKEYCIMANEFLQDVFYNLLHNSVKVTESREINIEVEVTLTQAGEYLRFDFIDWGIGLDDTMKKTILAGLDERVRRVSGVGLTLVKQIIDQYGGKISVEDRVKGDHTKGARFIILLPNGC
ncbi:PAS domain S-box protein [Candidatus Thorarchaeota archaeon]|nr:MAG: PAS domain S-box protein [Candidatus Thorarchaeota archaeon]